MEPERRRGEREIVVHDVLVFGEYATARAVSLLMGVIQVGNIFQGAVTLSWSAGGLLTRIGTDGIAHLKSLSRHSYPQSACGGASTNLPSLMSHSCVQHCTHGPDLLMTSSQQGHRFIYASIPVRGCCRPRCRYQIFSWRDQFRYSLSNSFV